MCKTCQKGPPTTIYHCNSLLLLLLLFLKGPTMPPHHLKMITIAKINCQVGSSSDLLEHTITTYTMPGSSGYSGASWIINCGACPNMTDNASPFHHLTPQLPCSYLPQIACVFLLCNTHLLPLAFFCSPIFHVLN